MTVREKTAVLAAVVGAVALVAGAYGFLGWPGAAVVTGVLALAAAWALGTGDPTELPAPSDEEWQVYQIREGDEPGGVR